MKKLLFIITLTVLTVSTYATDKKDDIKKVSYNALRHFQTEISNTDDVTWKVSEQYVRALYTQDGKQMGALYDLQGNYVGAVEYITYTNLPSKAKAEIEKKYKAYSFSTGLKIVDRPNQGSTLSDIGTYWVDLTNDVKQLFISISPASVVEVYKTFDVEAKASK